jgi:hypothetical protein
VSRCVHRWRLTEPDGRSPMAPACAAARAGGSAMCSSAMRPTRQPSGGASARSGSGVSAGLSECDAASTAAPSRPGPGVRNARQSADAHATSRTTPPVAGTVGPGSGRARRCWNGMGTGAWPAAPAVLGSRSTTSFRSRPAARTSPPTCERFASHATASDEEGAGEISTRTGDGTVDPPCFSRAQDDAKS